MPTGGKLVKVPDVRPIVLGHYTLTATGLDIKGRPSLQEHEEVGKFIQHLHKRSGFYLADWLRYGESREDWREKLDQAVDLTGLSPKTLRNVRAVGKMDRSVRRPETVDFSLHVEVAGMTAKDQAKWLAHAETEGWTERELRDAINSSRRRRVLDGRADEMFTIEVNVQIEVEAQSPYLAEQAAWEHVKQVVKPIGGKVIGSHARSKVVNE
jgi:hypothetical protein